MSQYSQTGADPSSSSSSTIRQQQLLEQLQQQRLLLQRQKQQLQNLLSLPIFPISPSNLARNPELSNPDSSQFAQAQDLAPFTLASSPESLASTSTRAQVASLPDVWSLPQQQPHEPDLKQPENDEDEPMIYDRDEKITNGGSGSSQHISKPLDDDMSSTSDFVKKLYRMLEDPTFQSVVCWGPLGDCFIVKDMNECTKSVLPRLFKHSNFASFVRQLNKYDFHKVKSTENNPYGEQSWTFRHPDFHADRPEALENIKRKPPAQRKSAAASSTAPLIPAPSIVSRSNSYSPSPYEKKTTPRLDSSLSREQFKAEVQPLLTDTESLRDRISVLEQNYERVLQEMAGLQQAMAQQDKLIHGLISSFLHKEGKQKALTDGFPIEPHVPYSSTAPLGAIGPPPGAQVYQSSEIGPLQGSSSKPMGRPVPPPSISREQVKEQIQAYLDSHNSLSYPASSLASSSSTLPLTRPEAIAPGSVYSGSQVPSSSSQPDRYNIPNESWQNFPQSTNISSNQVALLNGSEQQQQTSMPYVSSPGSTMSQTVNEQFPSPSSVESSQNNKDSLHPQVASPDITWDKTWEAMMASPFSLTPLPGFNTATENELNDDGLQVYTVGHLLPRSENKAYSSLSPPSTEEYLQGNWNFGANAGNTDRQFDNTPEDGVEETVQPTIMNPAERSIQPPQVSEGIVTPAERQKLRVRRSTFVPGWAVPPHVLLVDDDAVSRRLSSKFLEVFGCTVEVAVDGISAVNKMNLEKYDLVLMDIVMPKLDGVSATSLIRKFDKGTPIISMTGNSNPNQIMTYFSSGMNDILPKPFTKKGLLDMLEKHLMHLKVISQISKVPRPVGVPPMSDSNFKQALATSANNLFMLQQQQQQQNESSTSGAVTPFRPITPPASNVEGAMTTPSSFDFSLFDETTDEAQINPLAGMGVSDDQYKLLLQNIVNGDGFPGIMQSMAASPSSSSSTWGSETGTVWSTPVFNSEKRPLDDPDFEREEKRSRFEVIE